MELTEIMNFRRTNEALPRPSAGLCFASFRCMTMLFVLCQMWNASAHWRRHTIDAGSKGADGVRVADVNQDGRMDIVTGWEEGGTVRICVHPGAERVRQPWPSATIGAVASPEDAVWLDVDGDGATDVVSSCEGANRRIFVHWAPRQLNGYLDSQLWTTEPFPAVARQAMWMFAVPAQIDGRGGRDLVVGGKGLGAVIGWLRAPSEPRQLSAWKFQTLRDAGWIMSLHGTDLDQDGDVDILASDRKGPNRGVFWLENPGSAAIDEAGNWPVHVIGADNSEVMFLDFADVDRDKQPEVVVAVKPRKVVLLRSAPRRVHHPWSERSVELSDSVGTAKAVAIGDIDLDGSMDVVFSCEEAKGAKLGVVWFQAEVLNSGTTPTLRDISGPEGVKFDRLELIDLDGDGDLDVLTTEEAENLGVIWYENPRLP